MDKGDITVDVVAQLVANQFPEWAGLPIHAVDHDGWDNCTFRLGDELSVRLPSHERYVAQVEKEHRWLPVLAPQLPLPIPQPIAEGEPDEVFPRPWSIYRWIDGEVALDRHVDDPVTFASDLAAFLNALYAVDPTEAPLAGAHSFQRGNHVAVWDDETRHAIHVLEPEIDAARATAAWNAAVAAPLGQVPMWVHGDVVSSNLLASGGRLSAVIDFGCSAVGDPACDLVMAWTTFEGPSRKAFVEGLDLDEGTWARGRGWALWKALRTLEDARRSGRGEGNTAARRFGWRLGPKGVIDEVLADV